MEFELWLVNHFSSPLPDLIRTEQRLPGVGGTNLHPCGLASFDYRDRLP